MLYQFVDDSFFLFNAFEHECRKVQSILGEYEKMSVTRLIFSSCAAFRNPLSQYSLCLTIRSNTRRTGHSP